MPIIYEQPPLEFKGSGGGASLPYTRGAENVLEEV